MLNNLVNHLLDLLFPAVCVGCKRGNSYLCATCATTLTPADPASLKNSLAAYAYRDKRVQTLIKLLKYRHLKPVAPLLGTQLYHYLSPLLTTRSSTTNHINWLLVPIPLTAKRLRQRGFNQSALIGRQIVALHANSNLNKSTNFTLTLAEDLLVKTRHTTAQATLKERAERLQNLHGAFAVPRPALVASNHIILLDDVITTGSTMREASTALLQAGAASVLPVAIAHG